MQIGHRTAQGQTDMPGKGLRLLIVEDQELMAMTIASVVRRLKFDLVGSAATAERAVELAKSCQPDVVLMDLHLKGNKDGVATVQDINAVTNTRIVFLTGAANEADFARMQSVHPVGIVLKPFRRTELASMLAEAARHAATPGKSLAYDGQQAFRAALPA